MDFDLVLTDKWLYFGFILTEFWLHFDWILTEFWLNFDWILAAFWLYFGCILTAFWLHCDCILTEFWLNFNDNRSPRGWKSIVFLFWTTLVLHLEMSKNTAVIKLHIFFSEGTRIENCSKNIGHRKYAFGALQLATFPYQYRAPVGSFQSNVSGWNFLAQNNLRFFETYKNLVNQLNAI